MTPEPRALHDQSVELELAVETANVPILLMILHQLTGEGRWLEPPYRPSRARGMDSNPTGGLDPEIQDEVRAAALKALRAWLGGAQPVHPVLDGTKLTAMLSVAVGEAVSHEYADLLSHEMGFGPSPVVASPPTDEERRTAIVIGAGISGIAVSIGLAGAGIDHKILERHDGLGGTWWMNRYPGAGVDTPSHLYTFSYVHEDWPRHFARRQDVATYLERVADHFGVRERTRFGREVTAARWDEDSARWVVSHRGRDGQVETEQADYLVSAIGLLSQPRIPDVPGLGDFAGEAFHAADWPATCSVSGRRVAVVGSGATAMQIVPAIVDDVQELYVLQRSPQWIAPNQSLFAPVDMATRWLLENAPFYRAWHRAILWWTFGDRIHDSLRIDPSWPYPDRSVNAANDNHRAYFTRYLDEKLADRPDLRAKSLPAYPPFGKRMLLDNGWFDALKHDRCHLLDSPLTSLTETGVSTADGQHAEVDVVVFATGFDAKDVIQTIDIRGRNGQSIREAWPPGSPTAYLGMTVPGFPNLLVMYGPNTNLGHGGSYVFLAECQVKYMTDLLVQMESEGLASFECRADVHDEYNRRVDEAHDHLLWKHPAVDSWYTNERGRVVTNSPWRMVDYWHMTRRAQLDDFVVTRAVDQRPAVEFGVTSA